MNDDLTVFISYRRSDSSADAGRLYDALRRRFGRDSLFMDVDSLRPGEDWVEAVEGAVMRCDVLLAIIGPTWAGATDSDGELRLHKELDRVRLEIEAALRNGKPVIPVLVEGASMPDADELPDSLKPLLRRHAIRMSHPTFESDLGALVRALKTIDRARHPKPTAKEVSAPAATKSETKPESSTEPRAAFVAPIVAATPAPPVAPPTVTPDLGPAPVTLPYVAVQPPVPPTQPVYPVPPFQPAYPYQAPAYGQAQPAGRTGTSPVLIGLLALGFVLVIGFLVLAVLKIGPFAATAQASPTPAPTEQPTQVPPSLSPTAVPPTDTPVPPTATATSPPTPSSSPAPTSPPLTFDFVMSWVSLIGANRDACKEVPKDPPDFIAYWPNDASVVVDCGPLPVKDSTVKFYRRYALYPDDAALNAAYAKWVSVASGSTGVGTCPGDIPSEQGWQYSNPDTEDMGRELCFVQVTNPFLFFTARHAHLMGILVGQQNATQPTITQLADAFADSAGVRRP